MKRGEGGGTRGSIETTPGVQYFSWGDRRVPLTECLAVKAPAVWRRSGGCEAADKLSFAREEPPFSPPTPLYTCIREETPERNTWEETGDRFQDLIFHRNPYSAPKPVRGFSSLMMTQFTFTRSVRPRCGFTTLEICTYDDSGSQNAINVQNLSCILKKKKNNKKKIELYFLKPWEHLLCTYIIQTTNL